MMTGLRRYVLEDQQKQKFIKVLEVIYERRNRYYNGIRDSSSTWIRYLVVLVWIKKYPH
jgi:hypothetical protein